MEGLMETRKLLFLASILAAIWLSGCKAKQPNIELVPALNLGDVTNGDVVTREVKVQNDGEASLIVASVSTSCGCTKASLEPMTIPAGGSGILRIEFDSGAHGPDANGEIIRQIFVSSNDPDQKEFVLEVSANVLPRPALEQ